ncbi:hypothetical protein AVEN_159330-1 [Araneus ventricosus]|uniref:Uncharacterized protein n=1 Tax=Araneus ventricosus TaxID=182803 RepID=A0A4Y2A0H3_ARAVE|nr:hypothetical protein AVEN_159330-1 [Araneus ventricosus]
MAPTRRRPSAQGIKCPTVYSEHIPASSHRVWWWLRMASAVTSPEPIGLFSLRIHQTASVCNPSTNTAGNRIRDTCTCASPAMLYNVQREVQSRV